MNCAKYFDPDPRVGARQRYCSATACREVSKARSQQRWRDKPENQTYFCGPVHVARVKAWRCAHPGYARGARVAPALQDEIPSQPVAATAESGNRSTQPLQDQLEPSRALLAGLIAHLFQVTLQDQMAATVRRLVQLGTDVLGESRDGEVQVPVVCTTPAPSAEAVQVG